MANQEMVELFGEELKLCKIMPGETVAVLSEGNGLRDYAEAFLEAADGLDARTVDLNLAVESDMDPNQKLEQFGVNQLARNSEAMNALKRSDLIVDLMVASFSREQDEIQANGPRMILVAESFDNLKRLFPTEEQRRRTEASERRLAAARTFRFTNDLGTDVTYELGAYPIIVEYGYTDRPKRWDHWGGTMVATCGTATGVEGRVVMDKGDMLLPQLHLLEDPIEFVIGEGYVKEVNGGAEAAKLREFMEKYEDPRAYAVSHIGWGMNENAEWTTTGIGMNGRSYYGNVLFSLGPNTEFGGDNDTACHLDLPMKGCTAWLDDELIIEKGEMVPDDMRAPGR